jgi:protein arginine N-methyltransferase 7
MLLLTIEKTLEEAITCHKEGNLSDAESLYLAILESQPNHSDANHNLGILLMQTNNLLKALPFFVRALEVNPKQNQYWFSYINALVQVSDFDKVIQIIQSARESGLNENEINTFLKTLNINNPDYILLEALIAAFQDGRYKDVEILALTLIESYPLNGNARKVLGAALIEMGRITEALVPLQKAAILLPNDFEAHNNMGAILNLLSRPGEAEISLRKALKINPTCAEAHSNLGDTLTKLYRLEEAIVCYRDAIKIKPSLIVAHKGQATALQNLVPLWHVPMMNDTVRNEAYYDALRAVITSKSNVLEIGTGSGLLSMMAAKLGANSVTTCESEAIIATMAKDIIGDNGLNHRITVIAKKSTEVVIGEDLQQQADILVSEIFSSGLLGEYVLSSIEDAKRRLLKPDCKIIPASSSIMIALFGGNDISKNIVVNDVCGFNLHKFNNLVPKLQSISRNDLEIEMLSSDVEAFCFDFDNPIDATTESKILRIPVTASGRCLGFIQWIRLEMLTDVIFENHPLVKSPASAWTRQVYTLNSPVELKLGQVAIISAAHNRVTSWFDLLGIE